MKNNRTEGTVEQVVHYYPFGGQFADGTSSSLQEFKFTGKEWDSSKGQNLYDFGARTYDPALLRWTTPDPLSSKYPAWSPYAYCGNSPALFVDPDGKDWYSITDDYGRKDIIYDENITRRNFVVVIRTTDTINGNISVGGYEEIFWGHLQISIPGCICRCSKKITNLRHNSENDGKRLEKTARRGVFHEPGVQV